MVLIVVAVRPRRFVAGEIYQEERISDCIRRQFKADCWAHLDHPLEKVPDLFRCSRSSRSHSQREENSVRLRLPEKERTASVPYRACCPALRGCHSRRRAPDRQSRWAFRQGDQGGRCCEPLLRQPLEGSCSSAGLPLRAVGKPHCSRR